MIKTILASLTGFASDTAVLDAAFAVARAHGSHVACLHTRIDPIAGAALAGVSAVRIHGNLLELTDNISREQRERSQNARAAYAKASLRHDIPAADHPERAGGPSACLEEVTTFLDETLRRSRFHDLIVTTRVAELPAAPWHDIVMQSGRPVLIVPSKPVDAIGAKVMIAWKDRPEAARGLAASMPILARAKQVTIVSISQDEADADRDKASAESVAEYLRWHGVHAQAQMSNSGSISTAKKLEEIAIGLDADLLVMGAYGHGRMREFVFGGATRDLLDACAVPILMAH